MKAKNGRECQQIPETSIQMNQGSLYSGIGGWLLAARWAGIDNIFTCEIDKFCNKVIDKQFSEIPKQNRHHDIKETDFTKYRGTIDILSTSDPCQPFSFAGKRGGKEDDRFLWPFTIKAIRTIKPKFVVFENVPGFISMAFETVASDLEAEGYTVESFIIPACGIGAWHRRDRLWIIAYCLHNGNRQQMESGGERKNESEFKKQESRPQYSEQPNQQNKSGKFKEIITHTESYSRNNEYSDGSESQKISGKRFNGDDWWRTEPKLDRMVHGISSKLDENRIKSLGNSIVPQIAYLIFEAIKRHATI